MSTATATPRDSTTAKAPQLRGWIHIFSAGEHKDSKGKSFSATTDDLDQIIANHALGAAPTVIGHPKGTAPAYAWTEALQRKDEKLFCRLKDINPAFDDGVVLGAYRNRSVSLVNDPAHGLRLRHLGWLGAVPPAIDGLAETGAEFSVDDEGDVLEFSADAESAASSLTWAVEQAASLMRGLRDYLIERDGLDKADSVLPAWSIESLVREAAAAREALRSDSGSLFSHPNPGDDMTTITQAQLDAAVAQARKEAEEATRTQLTKDFSAQGSELAELRATRKTEAVQKMIDGLKASGKVLPAQEQGLREFLTGLSDISAFEFSAADADGAKVSKAPAEWFAEFMAGQKPLVKLGRQLPEDPSNVVDGNDADAIGKAAHEFQAAEAAAGRTVSMEFAVQHVADQVAAQQA